MAQDLGHILTCVLSLDLFKDELISLQHPRIGVIGRGIYKVTCKQEIRITRRRCPCIGCERDFGRDCLQVVMDPAFNNLCTLKYLPTKHMPVWNVLLQKGRPAELQELAKAAAVH